MVDAIQEFRVDTNGMKAEFGQTSGGIVNVATKSGTNEFHGSLYEFFRNDALDARNAFATQVDNNTGRIKPILRYNQYGGTVGGPVRIPKLYDGRNRSSSSPATSDGAFAMRNCGGVPYLRRPSARATFRTHATAAAR
jgi:hypothetical protein